MLAAALPLKKFPVHYTGLGHAVAQLVEALVSNLIIVGSIFDANPGDRAV